MLLAPGSIIEPGNFGRIINLAGSMHQLYRREMAYEAIRIKGFEDRPSRLTCLFCFPTPQEADLCRKSINGYGTSILYEVANTETNSFIADMNNGLLHCSLQTFDEDKISYYWRGWGKSSDPNAIVLREVLLKDAATIIRRL